VLLVAPAAAQDPTGEPVVYVVRSGDTLFSIAQKFDTTVAQLSAANRIADPTVISVGQRLVIPGSTAVSEPTPEAPEQPDAYIVLPGDTLIGIAERFSTTVEALMAANDLVDGSLIVAGQRLYLPSSAAAAVPEPDAEAEPWTRVHLARKGETLPFLAFRYGTSVWDLHQSNDLHRLGLLYPGQRLLIPPPLTETERIPSLPSLEIRPRPIGQGKTMLIVVSANQPLDLSGSFLGHELIFEEDGEVGNWALVGVSALTEAGTYPLHLDIIEVWTGDRLSFDDLLAVEDGGYSTYNVVVPKSRQALLDPTLSKEEGKLIENTVSEASEEKLWKGAFSYPLEGESRTTAPFGQRRSYSGGPVSSYHTGHDLGADKGTPVYAPAAGTVVKAEQLQIRGRVVILDHGLGVYTGFWHLSEIKVVEGQLVERGELVGLVGNSGLSSGAHLHWEMRVAGVPVDPLQWTRRAFP
jgi:murein DD-endopeptidase MepM/ murein hydrolase activator NlpD